MTDPVAEVVLLLRPTVRFVKVVSAGGVWRVRRAETGQPSFCVILDGACGMTVAGNAPLDLQAGDFVLIPATYDFSMSSTPAPPEHSLDATPAATGPGEFRLGAADATPDVRFLIGHCVFESPDAALLVSLLPGVMHVRRDSRLTTIVELVRDESRTQRPARELVMTRLLEVLLIEALRSTDGAGMSPGLVNGLTDARLASALRQMHDAPSRAWTVSELAHVAALSRSSFFDRFSRTVGMAPMQYLLAWRMALAKDLLRRARRPIAEVAERVGYSSASTFSVAFARYTGMPPARYSHAGAASADGVDAGLLSRAA